MLCARNIKHPLMPKERESESESAAQYRKEDNFKTIKTNALSCQKLAVLRVSERGGHYHHHHL
jgi:plasmid rolling circle replication initiator protein Rep